MSKPQILLAEMQTAGAHNTNPATVLHLENVAAWKKQRIVVIVPTGKTIASKVYLSHVNLAFPPNNGVARILTIDTEVGDAYSKTIEAVITHPEFSKWEFILTVEHDNMPPADGVIKLVAQMEKHPEFACIGGLYYTKGHGGGIGGQPQIWGDPKDPVLNFRPQMPDPNGGLVECCGTGMGFNLWRMKMFKDKKLRRPWFHTQTEGGISTQDLYFWADARKYGYRCAIDCSIKVGHYSLEEDFVY